MSGRSVGRLGAWLTRHLRWSYDLGLGLSDSANAAVAIVSHTAVGDRIITVQRYHCHSSVGDRLGIGQCLHRHSVAGRPACHFSLFKTLVLPDR